jgi:signal transduction histidine kinase
MIHDLVDLERVREGKFRMEMKPARIHDCLLRALRTVHSLCLENRILIQLDLPEELPEVSMDADRIVQVLVNLLSNCIKYSPEGSPITTTAKLENEVLEVSIRDHGPGVPGERLERIFDIYEGADSRGIRGELGTGLGLAISKRILEGHGGSIRAELPQGGGTKFVFTLPVPASAPAAASA